MFDVLSNYLASAVTPELKTTIEDAHKAFYKIGKDDYQDGFESILMVDDLVDAGITVQSIVLLTNNIQHQILEEHGVFINDDATMQIRTMFINALSIVQMYDDKDALLRTIQIDESPEEVFAEIVALVTSKTADEILPYIHSVTHRVIGLIKDLIEAECGGDISDEVRAINKKHTDALKEFISLTNNPALTIVGLIHNGLTVGYPFLLYANTIGRKLEEMTPEYAAQELYAMALASQDGCDNPQAIIIDNLENFISGIEHTTKIMNIVSAYQIQLQRNTQNG